jgi:hypothetical protein
LIGSLLWRFIHSLRLGRCSNDVLIAGRHPDAHFHRQDVARIAFRSSETSDQTAGCAQEDAAVDEIEVPEPFSLRVSCRTEKLMDHHIIVEELRFRPIGSSQDLGFKPLRMTINGKPQPPVFDAGEIRAINDSIRVAGSK